jgi:hypothetical protein
LKEVTRHSETRTNEKQHGALRLSGGSTTAPDFGIVWWIVLGSIIVAIAVIIIFARLSNRI